MALPGVNDILYLIGTVAVGWEYLEVYDVSPGKTFEGIGALVVYAEGLGIEATV